MQPISIYTSLPPRMSRVNAAGEEFGLEYLKYCLDSWRDHGFEPVTVNSEVEVLKLPLEEWGVRKIEVSRNAAEDYGKPFVYLDDFYGKISEDTDRVMVFANADIFFDFTDEQVDKIRNLRPGEAIVLRRIDIDDLDRSNPEEYTGGYDFLAMHSRDLARFESDLFALGVPWWDHFVPLIMRMTGMTSVFLEPSGIFHLRHEERWSGWMRFEVGNRFLKAVIDATRDAKSADAEKYTREISRIKIRKDAHLIRRIRFWRDFRTEGVTAMSRNELGEMGLLNRSMIEEWRTGKLDRL